MKPGFSLLELIFAIVVLGIVASFAVPKYLDTKDSALVSTLKRDVNTATTSLQSYYLLNQKLEKISDAISINETNWDVTDTKLTDKNNCLSIEVATSDADVKTIELVVDSASEVKICKKIISSGLESKTYDLY